MTNGERVVSNTDDKKHCFQVLQDLECISGRVDGSITSKKKMRNEIWSLTSHLGPPSWFITFCPADTKNPISLYFADTKQKFTPNLKFIDKDDAFRLIAKNPVASARFFHFVVEAFLKHVLGVNNDNNGLYGETSAYYGTVEQQGRLTLHLHLLLWIKNALTPQEIRDQLKAEDSSFQEALVQYLETVCTGEFLNTTFAKLKNTLKKIQSEMDYNNLSFCLPEKCSYSCENKCGICDLCIKNKSWWGKFENITNDLLQRENIHKHMKIDKDKGQGGCLDNSGICKARMPRPIVHNTFVDHDTGTITLKKNEPWLNTFTPILTYLLRCNTDVTCLLSGTAVKAVIAYVTDYVTKQSLKTYNVLNAIQSILEKNTLYIGNSELQKENTRKIMTQVINSLTGKLEIGAPMASQYLLGLPDHYTSHTFRPFYWKSYVNHILLSFQNNTDLNDEPHSSENVIVTKNHGDIIGLSGIDDYIYRPEKHADICLYDWIRLYEKQKIKKSSKLNHVTIDSDEINVLHIEDANTFLEEHPQHNTHHILLHKSNIKRIPDFIGGSLPCIDKAENDFYWCTMLTFFKPWRNGSDLKNHDDSWKHTFSEYKFSDEQKRIMKFFNIRYECYDARDDFSAQRKLSKSDPHYQWNCYKQYPDDSNDFIEKLYMNENVDEINDTFLNNIDEHGPLYIKRIDQMNSAENIAIKAGWLNDCSDTKPDVGSSEPIIPDILQNASSWQKVVAEERKRILTERKKNTSSNTSQNKYVKRRSDPTVEVVDYGFLQKLFSHKIKKDIDVIEAISNEFSLNEEQERAYRIITQHAISKSPAKLRMYLGGMGGTGKSQVIKALMKFFERRGELHRFLTVAPTGSSAAIIGGSTYHSVFGIHENSNSLKTLRDVKEKLQGVDYIFLDEVSMLSCQDMYRISAQLSKALNVFDEPFGGLNFIFAGDFAQLPPAGATPLYGAVKTKSNSKTSVRNQYSAIGKAIWHQVTTVVILRKNMRQQHQSVEDSKLRVCLENMRYKSCTKEDIEFLESRIAGNSIKGPKLTSSRFRNASIITAWNAQKDRINELGCKRFAEDNNRELTSFYSIDNWKSASDSFKERYDINFDCSTEEFPTKLRNILWNQPHSTSDHFPGRLDLCIGMPVMI